MQTTILNMEKNDKIFEKKRIVKTREQLVSVELTAQQIRLATVWLIRRPGMIAGDEKLSGWFLEVLDSDIVLSVDGLFKGTLTSEKNFPDAPVFKWKDEYKSKDPQVGTTTMFKNIVVSRMADENLLGYYDMLTPATPLVNRISGSFHWWRSGTHAPVIPFSPTSEKKEVLARLSHFETAFAQVSHPLPEFALDGLLALRILKDQLPDMKERGTQNVSRLVTLLVKAWAKSRRPSHFRQPLESVGYPTNSDARSEDRAKLFHNLLVGKGNDTVRELGFCLWQAPKITVTTDAEGFTSKSKAKGKGKGRLLDMGPDLKIDETEEAEPITGSFAESSAMGAGKGHIKKNSDPAQGGPLPSYKVNADPNGKEGEMLREEASEDVVNEIANTFTFVNFRRFARRVKRSLSSFVSNVKDKNTLPDKTLPEKVKTGLAFTVTSAVKAVATVPIAGVVGFWYGLKEPYLSIKEAEVPEGWKGKTAHVADCSVYAVTSIVTSTISGLFAGLASATR